MFHCSGISDGGVSFVCSIGEGIGEISTDTTDTFIFYNLMDIN